MTDSSLQRDNAFWQFSIRVFAAPGVAAECIALQEALGLDVNVLLFCAWLGVSRRVALTAAELEAVTALVRPWHEQVVRPLRQVRLQLKTLLAHHAEALRTRVKAVELEAEQTEQAMVFAYAEQEWPQACTGSPREIVQANVQLHLEYGCGVPDRADVLVGRLIDAALAYDPLFLLETSPTPSG